MRPALVAEKLSELWIEGTVGETKSTHQYAKKRISIAIGSGNACAGRVVIVRAVPLSIASNLWQTERSIPPDRRPFDDGYD